MASDGVPENSKAGRILAIDNDVDSSTAASVSNGFQSLRLRWDFLECINKIVLVCEIEYL